MNFRFYPLQYRGGNLRNANSCCILSGLCANQKASKADWLRANFAGPTHRQMSLLLRFHIGRKFIAVCARQNIVKFLKL